MPNLADILFRTADGIYAVDAEQHIIYWNDACAQLLGVSTKEAIGRPCSDVVRGKNSAGQPLCGGGCCSSLIKGGNGPKTFPLHTHNSQGNHLDLSVNIVLVPSRHCKQWTCIHMLYYGDSPDAHEVLEYHSPYKQKTISRSTVHGHSVENKSNLTAREHEILQLLAEGVRTTVISQLLHVSPVTVRNHIQHIESKLGVHSQLEAVAYAYRNNLVSIHNSKRSIDHEEKNRRRHQ